jgi:predicted pyridoxine 5'-phosphate oxidase superfamily flavin-nucleotide-binding protein
LSVVRNRRTAIGFGRLAQAARIDENAGDRNARRDTRMMEQAPPLTAAQTAFMQGPVSILAATHDAGLTPNLVRAHGCSVSADRRELTIWLAASQAGAVLADIRANRAVALVFCRPSTHQALQVKAADAEIIPAERDAAREVRRYHAQMQTEVGLLGFSEPMREAMFSCRPGDLVALRCMPYAVFEQTPGPNAGHALQPAGAQP